MPRTAAPVYTRPAMKGRSLLLGLAGLSRGLALWWIASRSFPADLFPSPDSVVAALIKMTMDARTCASAGRRRM